MLLASGNPRKRRNSPLSVLGLLLLFAVLGIVLSKTAVRENIETTQRRLTEIANVLNPASPDKQASFPAEAEWPQWVNTNIPGPDMALDPFLENQNLGYTAWHSVNGTAAFAVLRGVGPDGQGSMDLSALKEGLVAQLDNSATTATARQWLLDRIAPHAYDPTNGLNSEGDILRIILRQ